MDFKKLLEQRAKQNPDKAAIIFRDTPITYRQLSESASKYAAGLSALGISKGDKVAIYLPNIPEYIYSFLGVFVLRGVAVPLDFMLTEEEVINFIVHSECKILITQEKKGADLNNIKDHCPSLTRILACSEFSGVGSLPQIEAKKEDHSSIFYTSGSTGHPKGVLLNYGHLGNPIKTLEYFLTVTEEDSFICAGVPFSHVGGLDYMLFMLYFGTTLVLLDRFHPLEFLKSMEKYKISIFCIVPSMFVAVLSLKEYEKFDLSALRYAVVFGAPSSPDLLERFHRICPNAYLLNGWGMTETSAPNSYLPTGTDAREIEHTGKFPPGTEAKIVNEAGKTLGPEQNGELWIRGKAVMVGYYKEPELTAQALTKDGWLKTGDMARCDKAGRYSIVGRIKEMIKVAGEIVFAPEVEAVIHRHPKVQEVAVIGVADKLRGEVPKAFIIIKQGQELEAEEVRSFLRQHLAHFKIPHHFEFSADLPKNRVGKIDKEKLKQRI